MQVRIQPSEYVDHITPDGHELTKRPYPYFVTEDGAIERQDFWKGEPLRVIGFQADLADDAIDLWWKDALEDPHQAIGMYLVTEDNQECWSTDNHAVESIEIIHAPLKPVYAVYASPWEKGLVLEIPEVGTTQTHEDHPDDTKEVMARDLIAGVLDIPADSFDITFHEKAQA